MTRVVFAHGTFVCSKTHWRFTKSDVPESTQSIQRESKLDNSCFESFFQTVNCFCKCFYPINIKEVRIFRNNCSILIQCTINIYFWENSNWEQNLHCVGCEHCSHAIDANKWCGSTSARIIRLRIKWHLLPTVIIGRTHAIDAINRTVISSFNRISGGSRISQRRGH